MGRSEQSWVRLADRLPDLNVSVLIAIPTRVCREGSWKSGWHFEVAWLSNECDGLFFCTEADDRYELENVEAWQEIIPPEAQVHIMHSKLEMPACGACGSNMTGLHPQATRICRMCRTPVCLDCFFPASGACVNCELPVSST